MGYTTIKQAIENELSVEIQIEINRMFERLEKRHGRIHLTALDARAYKRHIRGMVKVLVRVMTRGQFIP